MGGIGALRDVIVVGMGPAGGAAATMLRDPASFRIAGEALDVLALEARSAVPSRMRVVGLQPEALHILGMADDLLGAGPAARTAPSSVATIAGVERTFRRAAEQVGVDARYGQQIASVTDRGRAGVHVAMADGTVHRGRFLVDATGGRLGPFTHGAPAGESVYLTGSLPPVAGGGPRVSGEFVRVHGAGNDRGISSVFAFNDVREGATPYVMYPSMPRGGDDARVAHRLLRRQLEAAGIDPRGLRDAAFIRTPLVRSPSAVDGSMLAVGDSVRRLSPQTALGVTNGLVDAHGAAWAVQEAITGAVPRDVALDQYAIAAARR